MERNKILFSVMPFTTDILIDKHRAMEDALDYRVKEGGSPGGYKE